MIKFENTQNVVLNKTISPFARMLGGALVAVVLLSSSSVFAFGGGGGGHGLKSTMYKGGVDSIGVHINGKSVGPIETTCPDRSEWDMDQLACVCEEGWVLDKDACVLDQCVEMEEDVCVASCDPLTGGTTFSPKDTPCGENMVCNGHGMCVCADGYEIWNETCALKCEDGYGRDANGVCQPCPATVGEVTTESLCDACFNGSFWNNLTCYAACTKVNYFHNKNGNCRTSCTDDTRVETTEKECYQSCGDQRKVVHYNNRTYCAVLECPDEAGVPQFQDHIGTCYSCMMAGPQPVKEAKDCTDACGGLRVAYEYHEDDRHRINCALASCGADQYHTNKGACALCSADNPNLTSAEECHLCNDSLNKRFMSADGSCYSCATTSQVVVSDAAECDICEDFRYMDGDACRACPANMAKLTDETQCVSCGGVMTENGCVKQCEGSLYCAAKNAGGDCAMTACCLLGGTISNNVGVYGADVCCYDQNMGYCSERDSSGVCHATDCCYSGPFNNTKIADLCVECAHGIDPYCTARDENGDCTSGACCTDAGGVIKSKGLNGTDLCCDHETEAFSCAEYNGNSECTLGACCENGTIAYCASRDENGQCIYVDCCLEGQVVEGAGENHADLCAA